MVKLRRVLRGVLYKAHRDLSGVTVKKVTNDSRKVTKGDLFIALRGYKIDGYKFIGSAVKMGAGVIVSERDFNAPKGVILSLIHI